MNLQENIQRIKALIEQVEEPVQGKCGISKACDKQDKEASKENWYYSRGWINGKICKPCYIKKSIEVRKELIKKGWKRKQ